MTTRTARFVVVLSALLLGGLATTGSRGDLVVRSDRPVNPFGQRIAAYTQLREQIITSLLEDGFDPTADQGREFRNRLGLAIQEARSQAQPGGIFCEEVAGRMRQMVGQALEGADDLLSEVPAVASVRVNDFYPEGEPLGTVPPSLLRQLDPLPQELQYRFLATSLILLDVDTLLIVDVIPDAFRRSS